MIMRERAIRLSRRERVYTVCGLSVVSVWACRLSSCLRVDAYGHLLCTTTLPEVAVLRLYLGKPALMLSSARIRFSPSILPATASNLHALTRSSWYWWIVASGLRHRIVAVRVVLHHRIRYRMPPRSSFLRVFRIPKPHRKHGTGLIHSA